MYKAKILLDSIGPSGKRITTWELCYPRMVHAELMTHRLFSRNTASSRAIPIEKLIEQVETDPAMPVWWGKNQSGMQAREELAGDDLARAKTNWIRGRNEAVNLARALAATGLHKQIVNRVLEPWMWITALVTATEFDNWFALRDHPDAQPEIVHLARMMRVAIEQSQPVEISAGEWHLPLVDIDDDSLPDERRDLRSAGYSLNDMKLISAGRCARVSYLTHDGKRDPAADIELAKRLAASGHWSPFEHIAQAMATDAPSGCFLGWKQFRKEFPGEHVGGVRLH